MLPLLRHAALALLLAPMAAAQPTFVLHNARIHTVDPAQPEAEAMAVEDGRIAAVGAEADLLARFPDWPRLDAEGGTVVPGLIDAHAHLMGLGQSLLRADLVGTDSKEAVVERLVAFAASLPEGAWLMGRGWDQNDWPAAAEDSLSRPGGSTHPFPTRHDLDAAFPERPVWLQRIDGHAAWANTAALRAAGIDPDAPAPADPEGGAVLRDAEGRPTGVFVDNAQALIQQVVSAPGEAELAEALERALDTTARYGLTGVHDAGAGLDTLALYRRFIDAGRFPLRVYAMIGGAGPTLDHVCAEGPLLGYGDDRLTVRSLKLYADGALGSRGAALLDDYADDPGNHGLLLLPADSLEAVAARAMRCGLQVNTHAIGDRGIRVVLDAYAAAIAETGGGPGRHRIEHAQIAALEDIPRFADLGLIASMQPTHATSDMPWAEDRVGAERIRGAYAWQRFRDAGVRLALGSDFPVERVDPLLGFYAAVTRQDAEGEPPGGWMPGQRLTREEALRGFTLDAAYAAFMEDEVGSLAPGKWADFVILSQDLMTVPDEQILGTRVLATYLGGEAVYLAPEAGGLVPED